MNYFLFKIKGTYYKYKHIYLIFRKIQANYCLKTSIVQTTIIQEYVKKLNYHGEIHYFFQK